MKLEDFHRTKKRHLFISFSFARKEKENYIKKYLPDAEFVAWKDITFCCNDILVKGESIKEFYAICVGLVAENERKLSLIRDYIDRTKIKYLQYGNFVQYKNKLLQTAKFANANILQPKTIIGTCSELTAKDLAKTLGLPIVSKIIDGSQGEGVEKHTTQAALTTFLNKNKNKDFIFQEFIPNDCDLRIFFFRGEILFTISRTRQDKKEFRNNLSLGGKQEFIEIPEEAKRIAIQVNNLFNFDFAGVDLMQDNKTKKWYVLEINQAPQFGGKNELVIPKMVEYLK